MKKKGRVIGYDVLFEIPTCGIQLARVLMYPCLAAGSYTSFSVRTGRLPLLNLASSRVRMRIPSRHEAQWWIE